MITNQHPHSQRLAVRRLFQISLALLTLALVPILMFAGLLGYYKGKIYPNISIGSLAVGGYPFGEAVAAISLLTDDYTNAGYINLSKDGIPIATLNFEEIGLQYNPREVVRAAYETGRSEAWYQRLPVLFELLSSPKAFSFRHQLNQASLDAVIEEIVEGINQPGVSAHLYLDDQGNIAGHQGEDGVVVDKAQLSTLLSDRFDTLSSTPVEIPMTITKNQVSTSQLNQTLARAVLLSKASLELVVEYPDERKVSKTLSGPELWTWLGFDGNYQETMIAEYLESFSQEVNTTPQDALFQVESGRVTTFKPSLPGVKLEIQASVPLIVGGLSRLEANQPVEPISLATIISQPTITTAEVNDLGIVALLGRGESYFKGSIPGRVHNVALTASKLHGVLVKPGERFSFNQSVGEISRRTGYQAAYVIQNGRTVLGDGGGVCQASTTLFRAILDAGMPIDQRKAHSYRVGYYEQGSKPGFDATVFSPSVDLTFTNDTSHHILIQASADTSNTYMSVELYGTPDGRASEISGYQQWDAVSAPAPIYQDDPTLPPGTIRQVDWAAPGLKVKFDYKVTKDGVSHFEKTFYSTYRPWQAVYLRGV